MINHPDSLNVRKIALVLAGTPFLFLLAVAFLSSAWHHSRLDQPLGVQNATPSNLAELPKPVCPPL
jgi:hypothetical protein